MKCYPNKIKVLLMLPLRPKKISEPFYVPDLGIGYLAYSLKKYFNERIDIEVFVKDLRISERHFRYYLIKNKFDFIGIKVFSSSIKNAWKTINLIRESIPSAIIIAGGPHVKAMPESILDQLSVDYAIRGEGEKSLVKLIDLFVNEEEVNILQDKFSAIPGLIWKNEQKVHCNKPAILTDLDDIKRPSWELMPPKSFSPYETRLCKNYPSAPVLLTRGCTYSCTFCGERNVTFRRRSIEKILEELVLLKNEYGVREFQVLDDNCSIDRIFFSLFCKELISNQMNMSWRIPGGVHINTLYPELCSLMKRSGCYELWTGIESGSQKILDMMKKGTTISQIKETVYMVKEYGIKVGGFFILGYPGETDQDRALTLDLVLTLPLDYIKFTIFIPQPGSEIFNNLQAEGRLGNLNNLLCSDNQFLNDFTNLTPYQLKRTHHLFSLRFYARSHIFLNILKDHNSITQIIYLLRLAHRFIIDQESLW